MVFEIIDMVLDLFFFFFDRVASDEQSTLGNYGSINTKCDLGCGLHGMNNVYMYICMYIHSTLDDKDISLDRPSKMQSPVILKEGNFSSHVLPTCDAVAVETVLTGKLMCHDHEEAEIFQVKQ